MLDDAREFMGPVLAAAGEIALRWFRTDLVADDKGGLQGYDPVTEGDRAVEAFLRDAIASRFPDHEIVGEEGGTTGPAGRYRWIIDPIDGTKAFVTGVPAWGTLVGLLDGGVPVAGWLHQPYLGETFSAVDGKGWYERGDTRRPLRTRPTTELADAMLYCTHSNMFMSAAERAAFDRIASAVRLQRFGGDCYSYGLLALGHIDLVVEASLQPYDIVPLIPIIQAAGGVVTGPAGELPLAGGFVVAAATRELHAEALDLLGLGVGAPHS